MSADKAESAQDKGNKLERAVAGIEAAIAKYNPALAHSNYRIETKKRVTIGGVVHELDVFVSFDFAPHHQTSVIFECKNWSAKVDKNEVIILAEKVKATGAQQGFLVARDFSSSAEAQAQKDDSRVKLLRVLDLLAGDGPWQWPSVRQVGPEDPQYVVHLIAGHGAAATAINPTDLPPEVFRQITELSQKVLGADVQRAKGEKIEGRQQRRVRHAGKFGPVTVDGRTIRGVVLEITYTFANEDVPITVVSRFDVPGYGRHLELDFDHPQRGPLRIGISAPES